MADDILLQRDDNEEDENDSDDEDGEQKSSTPPRRKWDMFEDIPPKEESGSQATQSFIEYSVRVQKVVAYIVTFIVVLAGGVVSKATLLLITSQIYPTKTETCLDEEYHIHPTISPLVEEKVLWTWVLLFLVWVPDIGSFIRSARFCFFKTESKPSLLPFLITFIMESLYAVGTALFVFEVLPNLDVVRGVMLTNAVCLVPGILRAVTRDGDDPITIYRWIADGLAVLFQLSALVAWPLYSSSSRLAWIAPAVICISCGFWLNYIPDSVPNESNKNSRTRIAFLVKLNSLKLDIKRSLYWTYLVISVWKIILTFCTMMAIIAIQGDLTVQEFFDKTPSAFTVHQFNGTRTEIIGSTLQVTTEPVLFFSGEFDWLYVAIVACGGAYACYVFSKFACKIMIQSVGMALPNLLVVPCTVALLVIFDELQSRDLCFSQHFLPHYIFWNTDLTDDFITDKLAWIWLLWLVSQGWITFHVWSPQNERLASTEKLLTTPMYSAVVVDQSVCMNRVIEDEIKQPKDEGIPHVIACATMWHESLEEMLEMFKSILRLDMDQCARKLMKEQMKSPDAKNNHYEFRTEIFFDDAFTLEKDGSTLYVINSYVRDMMRSLPMAVREVYHSNRINMENPEMFPTPYGGRLVYQLPAGNMMTVHLKDKNKIRHRKRWSQCMYMYYLLGFQLMDTDMDMDVKDKLANNTFLLALDGDIDFQPKAVRLLVDLMKKNDNLGAACGRIHPVGSGLMAWYQIFEYAIGHWLQKATEHMIGCVLCSPGCFSLFRGSALMDKNVMRTYTKNCEIASHYVQYDQGEDRWLCTLLLQRGYRVEYSAASDAYTHCPENFNEFYNQRRRWVPSTMANIMDLLGSYKRTIEVNSNISLPYIAYQTMLLGGTILGPGTIFLMLVGAFVAAFKIDNWTSFYYNLIPIILFILVCLFLKANIQLMFALVISTVYGLIMMAVLVGILIQIQEDGPLAPSTLFLFVVAGEIIVAGLVHPQEVYCLPSGTIYYITIPSMYLLLIIYSVCNLNVVSWGTREVAEKKTKEQLEEEQRNAQLQKEAKKAGSSNAILAFLESFAPNKKEKGSIDFSLGGLFRCMLCTQPADDERESLLKINETLVGVTKRLDNIERSVSNEPGLVAPPSRRPTIINIGGSRRASSVTNVEYSKEEGSQHDEDKEVEENRDDMLNPYWIEDDDLRKAKRRYLKEPERKFWVELIARYLLPIDEDKKKQEKIAGELRELRDKMVLTFFMLNALFVTIVFLLQLNKDTIYVDWPLGAQSNITFDTTTLEIIITQRYLKLEPIGLVFVIFFAIILLIQFTGMFLHRFETLCHVLATTSVFRSKEIDVEDIIGQAIADAQQDMKNTDSVTKTSDARTSKDELTNRRKTVALDLAVSYDEKPTTVNVQSVLKKRLSKIDEDMREKQEKASRPSYFSKRMSFKRSSVDVGHVNKAFNGFGRIDEES